MTKTTQQKDDTLIKKANKKIFQGILFSMTLGLAPFFPEPHIWGKLKWVAGGGVGMQPMDYFDLILHGAPWLFLSYALVKWGQVQLSNRTA